MSTGNVRKMPESVPCLKQATSAAIMERMGRAALDAAAVLAQATTQQKNDALAAAAKAVRATAADILSANAQDMQLRAVARV